MSGLPFREGGLLPHRGLRSSAVGLRVAALADLGRRLGAKGGGAGGGGGGRGRGRRASRAEAGGPAELDSHLAVDLLGGGFVGELALAGDGIPLGRRFSCYSRSRWKEAMCVYLLGGRQALGTGDLRRLQAGS